MCEEPTVDEHAARNINLGTFIDSVATTALEEQRIAGLSVAVAQAGRVVHASGYGYSDVERQIFASADTVYGIGSLTKAFTAAAVIRLVERQAINLDERLAEYLVAPDLTLPVTVRHLLNHTSGLKGEADLDMFQRPTTDVTVGREDLPNILRDDLFDARPGHAWRYSNFGYVILGFVLERVTGRAYRDLIQELVLDPARLGSTWYGPPAVPDARLAKGYTDEGGRFCTVAMPMPEQTFSSGALYATVADLVAWQLALLDGLVVSRSGYAQMINPYTLNDGSPLGYGFGCFVTSLGGHGEISHDGTSGGYSSQLASYPDDQLIVAVLTNSESHEAERIEKRIARHVLGVEKPSTHDLSVGQGALTVYEGTYLHRGQRIPVYIDSDSLMAETPGKKTVRLIYQGDHAFAQDGDPAVRFEFTVHSTRADGFVVRREGKTLATLRRAP